MLKKLQACLVLFLLLWYGTALAEKAANVITVIGSAAISNTNIAGARETAIKNGLALAVDQMAVHLTPSEKLVPRFEEVNQVIFKQTEQFISTYQVLAENKTKTAYRVLIQVTIDQQQLTAQLPQVQSAMSNLPTVLFCIAETGGENPPGYWWRSLPANAFSAAEVSMEAVFKEMGFQVILHPLVLPEGLDITDQPDLDPQDALNLAAYFKADIVIIGRAAARSTQNTMDDSTSYSSTVSAKAIIVAQTSGMGPVSQSAMQINTEPSKGLRAVLSEAGAATGKILGSQIIKTLQNQEKTKGPGGTIAIIVGGTQHLGNFVHFRRILNDMPGVTSIKIRAMQADEATIAVDYNGTAREIADALMLKTFPGFGVNLYDVGEENLRIELKIKE